MCLAIPGKIKSIETKFDGLFRYLEEMGEVAEELNISEFLPDKEEYSDKPASS